MDEQGARPDAICSDLLDAAKILEAFRRSDIDVEPLVKNETAIVIGSRVKGEIN